ncbi:MAG TPA: DUF2087 domain-containing protein [Ktedonobacteraceae bacterium]|jgi:hypothetical protein
MDPTYTHLHLVTGATRDMRSAQLRRYLDDAGRVKSWPAKRATRMLVSTYLASFFQPGQVYSEQEANHMLSEHLACAAYDYATVRRDLCFNANAMARNKGTSEPQKREAEPPMELAQTKRASAMDIQAEHILAEVCGAPVRLGSGADLGGSARSRVVRFPIRQGPASCPASVIVKQANTETFEPDTANNTTWWFFNDWASLQFLNQLETPTPLAPRFYGGNRQAGLFVMENLGQGRRLDYLLLGNNAEIAEAGLLAYAKMHGCLHALTLRQEGAYLRIREALGPATPQDPCYHYAWLTSAQRSMADLLELEVAPEVEAELAALETLLTRSGPFHAFIQADAAPDNVLHDGASWRLIDFEGGHYTHALLEGVYRLPDEIMQRAETTYRAKLARACPEATDDKRFYQAVVEACVTWALNFHTHIRPLEKMLAQDRSLVALTDRQQLLLYLNAAAHACAEFGHMPATGTSLRAMATRLSHLWPEAVEPPCYPAFCSGTLGD